MIERYENARELVLGRNPEFGGWSRAAQPDGFPDRIVWRFGVEDEEQVTETLGGRTDLMFRELPPDLLANLASSHAGQVHFTPRGGNYFMALDTVIPPFDDLRVRRALNFAVDRTVIAELFAGTGSSTCQILPPNFPGYVPYCPYTRNPNGTWTGADLDMRVLLEFARGSRVTVWATTDYAFGIPVPVGHYFVDLLKKLGYRATLRVVEDRRRFFSITLDRRAGCRWPYRMVRRLPSESGFILPVAVLRREQAPMPSSAFGRSRAHETGDAAPAHGSGCFPPPLVIHRARHHRPGPVGPVGEPVLGEPCVRTVGQFPGTSAVGAADRPDVGAVRSFHLILIVAR